MSIEEINRRIIKLSELKTQLMQSDYKAIKHSEGLLSDEDYAPIRAEREAIRQQIRAIEENVEREEQRHVL